MKMRIRQKLPFPGLMRNLPARAKATLAVVAIVGLATSAYVYLNTSSSLQQEKEEAFKDDATARIRSVEDSLQNSLTSAASLRALFRSSEEVTYREFLTFAAQTDAGLSHAQLAAWAPRISGEDRLTTELNLRKERYPDFQFREMSDEGHLVPAEPRDEYYPLTYLWPSSGKTTALTGLDMAAEPRVREAMANLGPGGKAVVKMMLPQETEALRPTLLLLQSVQRRRGTNPVSGEVDYGEEMGFVVTEVCVECAVDASDIHEDQREADSLFITIRDGDPEKGAGVLAQNFSPPPTPQDQLPSVASPFTLGGRDLHIQVTATENLYRRGDSMLPLALAGSILVAVSSVLLYILLLHRRAQDQTMLADRMRVAREALEMEVKEREKMEGHLRRAQRAESVGRLSGGIAHDFNNLLTAVVGNTSLLLSDNDLKEGDRRLVEEIDSAASMATDLTSQLLAFSSRQVLQPELVYVDQVVGGMERILRLFLGTEIELDLQLSGEAECVHVDVGQLQQTIVNLVVNAGDAIPEDRGRVTVATEKVWVSDWIKGEEQPPLRGGEQMNEFVSRVSAPEGPYVRLTVADNGVGMSATVLEQAFEPFFTTKERGKGTGLGLAAIHGIMTQSGGMIRAYSAGGKGTVIAIYLPEAECTGETLQEPANAPEPSAPEPAAEERQTAQFGRSSGVMVVDDEQSVRRIAARTLEGQGYEVVVASDGEEALRLSSQMDGNLDLLITDVLMPGMNGPALATRLQRENPDMAVLYISGYAADTFSREAIQMEMFDLLEKPFRPEELTERVEAALARRGALSDEAP